MKTCKKCSGTGKVSGFFRSKTCSKCNGRGHIVPGRFAANPDSGSTSIINDDQDYQDELDQISYNENSWRQNTRDSSSDDDRSSSSNDSRSYDSSSSDDGSSSSSSD